MNYSNITQGNKSVYIKGVVFGVIIGILTLIALMGITSVIFLKTGKLPGEIIQYIILVINAVGTFFAGYLAARIIKSGGIKWGAVTGFTLFVILVIAGFMSGSDSVITSATLYKAVISILFGIIGGIKGVNIKEKIKMEKF